MCLMMQGTAVKWSSTAQAEDLAAAQVAVLAAAQAGPITRQRQRISITFLSQANVSLSRYPQLVLTLMETQ